MNLLVRSFWNLFLFLKSLFNSLHCCSSCFNFSTSNSPFLFNYSFSILRSLKNMEHQNYQIRYMEIVSRRMLENSKVSIKNKQKHASIQAELKNKNNQRYSKSTDESMQCKLSSKWTMSSSPCCRKKKWPMS